MAKKIVIAGLLGGLVMFAWGFVSHMLLPLGGTGVRALPNEAPVTAAIKGAVPDSGMYWFPWEDMADKGAAEEEEALKRVEERMKVGPTGLLVVDVDGGPMMDPMQLVTELVTNVLAALVAALLLALAAPSLASYGMRVWFTGLLGLVSSLSIEASYWNWHGFPTAYTLAQFIIEIVGWTLVGFVLAAFVKRPVLA